METLAEVLGAVLGEGLLAFGAAQLAERGVSRGDVVVVEQQQLWIFDGAALRPLPRCSMGTAAVFGRLFVFCPALPHSGARS